MIKDLVVNLGTRDSRRETAAFGISVASAFEAHVAGIAFVFDPVIAPTVMDGLSAAWVDTQRDESRAAAQAAIEHFESSARRAGCPADHQTLEHSVGGAAHVFGQLARGYDLAVVGQSEPDRPSDDLFIEAALFGSGHPIIVVPYIQKQGLKLGRTLLCWDGGHHAARAIADAMPFLRRSAVIEIVTVSPEAATQEAATQEEVTGADIGQHLARHGLKVDVKHLATGDIDAASAILSYAADRGTDFIVMGGYGHSRLREFVLGGMTRSMLGAMTVPILMSH
jgi:nucleotide-binding universal stress UspA family protein